MNRVKNWFQKILKRREVVEEPSPIEDEIESVLGELSVTTDPDEYNKRVENLILLKKAANMDKEKADSWWRRIDPNAIIKVVGSLMGILVILRYEDRGVLPVSKAMTFLLKP